MPLYTGQQMRAYAVAAQLAAPVAPEGYRLVPVEPTPAMQMVGAAAVRIDTTVLNKVWTGNAVLRAMIAAVSAQPETWKVLPSPPTPAAAAIKAAALEETAPECERVAIGPFEWNRTPAHKTVWNAAKAIRRLVPTGELKQEAASLNANHREGTTS